MLRVPSQFQVVESGEVGMINMFATSNEMSPADEAPLAAIVHLDMPVSESSSGPLSRGNSGNAKV